MDGLAASATSSAAPPTAIVQSGCSSRRRHARKCRISSTHAPIETPSLLLRDSIADTCRSGRAASASSRRPSIARMNVHAPATHPIFAAAYQHRVTKVALGRIFLIPSARGPGTRSARPKVRTVGRPPRPLLAYWQRCLRSSDKKLGRDPSLRGRSSIGTLRPPQAC
jgi:hypothetical protein